MSMNIFTLLNSADGTILFCSLPSVKFQFFLLDRKDWCLCHRLGFRV